MTVLVPDERHRAQESSSSETDAFGKLRSRLEVTDTPSHREKFVKVDLSRDALLAVVESALSSPISGNSTSTEERLRSRSTPKRVPPPALTTPAKPKSFRRRDALYDRQSSRRRISAKQDSSNSLVEDAISEQQDPVPAGESTEETKQLVSPRRKLSNASRHQEKEQRRSLHRKEEPGKRKDEEQSSRPRLRKDDAPTTSRRHLKETTTSRRREDAQGDEGRSRRSTRSHSREGRRATSRARREDAQGDEGRTQRSTRSPSREGRRATSRARREDTQGDEGRSQRSTRSHSREGRRATSRARREDTQGDEGRSRGLSSRSRSREGRRSRNPSGEEANTGSRRGRRSTDDSTTNAPIPQRSHSRGSSGRGETRSTERPRKEGRKRSPKRTPATSLKSCREANTSAASEATPKRALKAWELREQLKRSSSHASDLNSSSHGSLERSRHAAAKRAEARSSAPSLSVGLRTPKPTDKVGNASLNLSSHSRCRPFPKTELSTKSLNLSSHSKCRPSPKTELSTKSLNLSSHSKCQARSHSSKSQAEDNDDGFDGFNVFDDGFTPATPKGWESTPIVKLTTLVKSAPTLSPKLSPKRTLPTRRKGATTSAESKTFPTPAPTEQECSNAFVMETKRQSSESPSVRDSCGSPTRVAAWKLREQNKKAFRESRASSASELPSAFGSITPNPKLSSRRHSVPAPAYVKSKRVLQEQRMKSDRRRTNVLSSLQNLGLDDDGVQVEMGTKGSKRLVVDLGQVPSMFTSFAK